jgi:NADPH:quinone reductase-like Zn-dependent oxidoreductase
VVVGRLNARVNDVVLVTGASGGMGTATMLIAKLAGCSVIATTRYAAKAEALKAQGADLVVDITRPDAAQEIRAFTRGEGVDGAVEYTGATELMPLCIDVMRMGGTFCPVGGEMKEIPLGVVDMIGKELNVHGVRASTRNDQRIVLELLEKGRIRMPIYATLPLSKVGEAHRLLEHAADLVGRIVLHPWDE